VLFGMVLVPGVCVDVPVVLLPVCEVTLAGGAAPVCPFPWGDVTLAGGAAPVCPFELAPALLVPAVPAVPAVWPIRAAISTVRCRCRFERGDPADGVVLPCGVQWLATGVTLLTWNALPLAEVLPDAPAAVLPAEVGVWLFVPMLEALLGPVDAAFPFMGWPET